MKSSDSQVTGTHLSSINFKLIAQLVLLETIIPLLFKHKVVVPLDKRILKPGVVKKTTLRLIYLCRVARRSRRNASNLNK